MIIMLKLCVLLIETSRWPEVEGSLVKKQKRKMRNLLHILEPRREILEFANLPPRTLSDILGQMTLKDAKREVRDAKALIRIVNKYEKRFNAIINPNQSHHKRNLDKWVTFDALC